MKKSITKPAPSPVTQPLRRSTVRAVAAAVERFGAEIQAIAADAVLDGEVPAGAQLSLDLARLEATVWTLPA